MTRRGYIPRPLLDEHLEPTTRAELEAAERNGDTGYGAPRERPVVVVDPALVGIVARLQRGAS